MDPQNNQPVPPQEPQPTPPQDLYGAAQPVQQVVPPVLPQTPTPPPASVPPAPISPPTPTARKFPQVSIKLVAMVLGGIALLAIIGFLLYKFVFNAQKKPQEITLTYWGLWEDQGSISGLISEYETQTPGVKINYVKQAKEDYRERLSNAQSQSGGPDIFRFHNTWVPMFSANLSALPPEVMDANTFQETFYPTAAKDLQRGADLVGIPLMYDGLGLYINEEIFNQEQKDAPATWDDLRKLARELTVKDDEGRIVRSGVALGRTENIDHWEDILALMMVQNGADLTNPTDELAQGALTFYTLFATDDLVWDETLPPSTQAFAGGKVAMILAPSWRAFEIKQQNPNLSFRVVPVPQIAKLVETQPDITWASYWVEGVSAKSQNQLEAWKFLKFLSEKSSQQKLYSNASQSRLFGPIYSRRDMAVLLENDPIVGTYVKQAPYAQSWYLTSRTFDGPTGINSRISTYYKDAVNGVVIEGYDAEEVLPVVAQGVTQVLTSYGANR